MAPMGTVPKTAVSDADLDMPFEDFERSHGIGRVSVKTDFKGHYSGRPRSKYYRPEDARYVASIKKRVALILAR